MRPARYTPSGDGYPPWENDEHRAALRHNDTTPCYRHDMRPDGKGGGVCRCGETIRRDDL